MVHATNHSNSQGNITPFRELAQARRWPSWGSEFSLRRDEQQGFISNSRSGETRNVTTSRILAQARRATWVLHDFSLRRDLLAWARHGVAQNVDRSPRRALVAVSTLILSPRRDKLAWAKISAFTTVNPHAVAETAQIHSKHTCNGGNSSTQHPKTHATQFHSTTAHIQT